VDDTDAHARGLRRRIRWRGIVPVIPTRRHEPCDPSFDRAAYRRCNRAERPIDRLKRFRRIVTRDEKRGVDRRAMIAIAMTLLWLLSFADTPCSSHAQQPAGPALR
jgi:transposase